MEWELYLLKTLQDLYDELSIANRIVAKTFDERMEMAKGLIASINGIKKYTGEEKALIEKGFKTLQEGITYLESLSEDKDNTYFQQYSLNL